MRRRAATGLPLIEVMIPPACDNATYESAFAAGLRSARERWPQLARASPSATCSCRTSATTAWRCARAWAGRCGRRCSAAIPRLLAREMQSGGLRAALCCVDTQQLSADFAGRDFDASLLRDLPEASIPAARTASSIPASTPGRCSTARSRSNVARPSCATRVSPTPISCSCRSAHGRELFVQIAEFMRRASRPWGAPTSGIRPSMHAHGARCARR